MIKTKRARRTARTLRQIKLRWIEVLYWNQSSLLSQRLLSCKHMHDYNPEKNRLEGIDCIEKIKYYNMIINRLYKQIRKGKLKQRGL